MTEASRPQFSSPSMRRRGYLALAFNAGFFAFLSWWLYHNVRYDEFVAQLQRIPPGAVFIAMAMNVLVVTLYGFRIATILREKPFPCFLITNIGFTFNALIPLRIGEGVRLYFGAARFKMPIGGLGAAIVLEKLYDLSAIILLAFAASSDLKIIDFSRTKMIALLHVVVISALLIIKLRSLRAEGRLPHWKILKALRIEAFADQAETLFADHNAPAALGFTATIWALNACLVYLLFSTLLPDIPFTFMSAMSLLVIGALAIAVPASPAGLGIFEAGLVSYLTTVFGVQTEQAISAALTYHLCITAPHTVIVILFFGVMLWRMVKERVLA